jgi:DNA repair protein RadC
MTAHIMTVRTVEVSYDAPAPLRPVADAPLMARAILRGQFARFDADVETFVLMVLDARHRVIGFKRLHTGTANACGVDAAKLFRAVLVMGGRGFIVAHNHPSGDVKPSADDIALTSRLVRGARLIGLECCDHIVITQFDSLSIRVTHSSTFNE